MIPYLPPPGLGWRRMYVSMARETSTRRLPGFMAAMPAHIDSSVTRESSTSSGACPEPTKAV
ncbi:hypothetical protein SALBM311S_00217 [Streptomyces alboniger]